MKTATVALAVAGLLLVGCAADAPEGDDPEPSLTEKTEAPPQASPVPPEESKDGAELEQTSLKVGASVRTMAFLPLILAERVGTWQDEGLDVTLNFLGGGGNVAQAIVGGSVDINVASPVSLVSLINQDQEMKSFWAGFNTADFTWWTQPDLESWDDMVGKEFAITSPGSQTDLLTRTLAETAGGISADDIGLVAVGPTSQAFAALRAGAVDATFLSSPTAFQAEEEGFNLLATQRDAGAEDWLNVVAYAYEDFYEENPETVRAFLRGIQNALQWAEDNKDEAVEVIEAEFETEYGEESYEAQMPSFYADGRLPSDEAMDLFWDLTIQGGNVDEPWELERWWDPTFVSSQEEWSDLSR